MSEHSVAPAEGSQITAANLNPQTVWDILRFFKSKADTPGYKGLLESALVLTEGLSIVAEDARQLKMSARDPVIIEVPLAPLTDHPSVVIGETPSGVADLVNLSYSLTGANGLSNNWTSTKLRHEIVKGHYRDQGVYFIDTRGIDDYGQDYRSWWISSAVPDWAKPAPKSIVPTGEEREMWDSVLDVQALGGLATFSELAEVELTD